MSAPWQHLFQQDNAAVAAEVEAVLGPELDRLHRIVRMDADAVEHAQLLVAFLAGPEGFFVRLAVFAVQAAICGHLRSLVS